MSGLLFGCDTSGKPLPTVKPGQSNLAAHARYAGKRSPAEVSGLSKINPWVAQPLSQATKNAKFRQVMALQAERVILGRSAIIAGWVIGASGMLSLWAAIFLVVMLMPLKTVEVKFYTVDQSTGMIGEPVSIADAPKTFGAAVEQYYLRRYIEAREAWVPEMDRRNDHIAKIMSTPDEQARIAAARNRPDSPTKLGKDGHAELENYRFHPLAIGKDKETRRYLVQYFRTVWHGQNKDPAESWSALVDFQFHPELPMKPDDRTDNPGGFQALTYSASSDALDPKRRPQP